MTFCLHDAFGTVCQHHMLLLASRMALLHSLGQDNRNKMQHSFFSHMMPLELVSHDADGIINGNIGYLRSR